MTDHPSERQALNSIDEGITGIEIAIDNLTKETARLADINETILNRFDRAANGLAEFLRDYARHHDF